VGPGHCMHGHSRALRSDAVVLTSFESPMTCLVCSENRYIQHHTRLFPSDVGSSTDTNHSSD
jgi:hypothetical protein